MNSPKPTDSEQLRAAFNVLQIDLHTQLWPNSEALLLDSFTKFESSIVRLIQERDQQRLSALDKLKHPQCLKLSYGECVHNDAIELCRAALGPDNSKTKEWI
jgi:hypothetical protein